MEGRGSGGEEWNREGEEEWNREWEEEWKSGIGRGRGGGVE